MVIYFCAAMAASATVSTDPMQKSIREKYLITDSEITRQRDMQLSTQNLEDVVSQIDLLLNDKIDILVRPWEFKEPNFDKAYKNGRYIGNAASPKRKTTVIPNTQES
jgi:hypothetical protein